jgi:ABC-2 type transport system permease protein
MMLVILIPRLSIDLAAQQHPLPSATEFWEGIKRGEGLEAGASLIPAERAAALRAQVRDELLQRYGVTQVEALPVNFTAVYLQRLEERDAPIFDRAYGTLWQTQEQQRQARTLWAVLSPTVSLREISMALAGTDPFAMMHFSEAAEQHRRRIVQMLNEKQAIEGAGKAFYVAPAETWQSIPSFIYAPPGWAEVWARHQRDFFVLLMWAVIPLMIAVTLAGRRREI